MVNYPTTCISNFMCQIFYTALYVRINSRITLQSSPIEVGVSATGCFSVLGTHGATGLSNSWGANAKKQNLAVQAACKAQHALLFAPSVLPISLHHFALVRSAIVAEAHQVPLRPSFSLSFFWRQSWTKLHFRTCHGRANANQINKWSISILYSNIYIYYIYIYCI